MTAPHAEPTPAGPCVTLRALPGYEPSRGLPLPGWRPRRRVPLRALPPLPPGPTWGEPPEMELRLRRLVGTLLEALDGSRPVTQVRMLVTEGVYESVSAHAQEAAATGARYRLRTLRSCRPTELAVELTAVVGTGVANRDRAVVARLDRRSDGWLCTVLAVVG